MRTMRAEQARLRPDSGLADARLLHEGLKEALPELGEDKEVQALLLKKIREKGLTRKLLTEVVKG